MAVQSLAAPPLPDAMRIGGARLAVVGPLANTYTTSHKRYKRPYSITARLKRKVVQRGAAWEMG